MILAEVSIYIFDEQTGTIGRHLTEKCFELLFIPLEGLARPWTQIFALGLESLGDNAFGLLVGDRNRYHVLEIGRIFSKKMLVVQIADICEGTCPRKLFI